MPDIRICPTCRRVSVEYDYGRRVDRCVWRDCGWTGGSPDKGKPRTEYSDDFRPAIVFRPELFVRKRVLATD